MSPPTSSPSGAATAASRPSRAAPTAVIAPPPGERSSSAANRSSPERRQRLEPDERQVEEDRGGDDEVGHGRPRITAPGGHATSARITSPVSSALVTKPRAPDSATSEPKSRAVPARREDDRRLRAGLPQARGDLEPVDVGQLDVEQQDVRGELERRGDRRTPRRSRCRPRRSRRSRARSARSPGRTGGRRRSTPSRASRDAIEADRLTDHHRNLLRRSPPAHRGGSPSRRGCSRPMAVRRSHPCGGPAGRGSTRPVSSDVRSAAARSRGAAAGEVPCAEGARRRFRGAAVPQRARVAGTDAARGGAVGHVDDSLDARERSCAHRAPGGRTRP